MNPNPSVEFAVRDIVNATRNLLDDDPRTPVGGRRTELEMLADRVANLERRLLYNYTGVSAVDQLNDVLNEVPAVVSAAREVTARKLFDRLDELDRLVEQTVDNYKDDCVESALGRICAQLEVRVRWYLEDVEGSDERGLDAEDRLRSVHEIVDRIANASKNGSTPLKMAAAELDYCEESGDSDMMTYDGKFASGTFIEQIKEELSRLI